MASQVGISSSTRLRLGLPVMLPVDHPLTALAYTRGWIDYNVGWEMAGALALWGGVYAVRTSRATGPQPPAAVDEPRLGEADDPRVPQLTSRP